jgi:hypothetical protein
MVLVGFFCLLILNIKVSGVKASDKTQGKLDIQVDIEDGK